MDVRNIGTQITESSSIMSVFGAEADMKREMERKEQEKKKSQKIEYISGGTQGGTLPTPKVNLPVPGLVAILFRASLRYINIY